VEGPTHRPPHTPPRPHLRDSLPWPAPQYGSHMVLHIFLTFAYVRFSRYMKLNLRIHAPDGRVIEYTQPHATQDAPVIIVHNGVDHFE
jgi:hypothetical protein